MLNKMTRLEMENEIVADSSLYAEFNESRLLDGGYSDDEMRATIQAWIEAGDETAN